MEGFRTELLGAYSFPKFYYESGEPKDWKSGMDFHACIKKHSAAAHLRELGVLCWVADKTPSRKRRRNMNVKEMVEKWKVVVVGLAVAHSKDEADRFEASIEECLSPILTAPIKQVREFAQQLATALEEDPKVPYLVHRAFGAWVALMKNQPDEDVKLLKTELAREIVEMVEDDAKRDLPAAMVRALQWRSPKALENVKEVVAKEKEAGRPVRLRGRESCLFLEAGGTEEEPKVCIQV